MIKRKKSVTRKAHKAAVERISRKWTAVVAVFALMVQTLAPAVAVAAIVNGTTYDVSLNATESYNAFPNTFTVDISGTVSGTGGTDISAACFYAVAFWGDGTNSIVLNPFNPPSAGSNFNAPFSEDYTGSKTYSEAGPYDISVELRRITTGNPNGCPSASIPNPAHPVRESATTEVLTPVYEVNATPVVTDVSVSLTGTASGELYEGSQCPPAGFFGCDDYDVEVNWGDGNTTQSTDESFTDPITGITPQKEFSGTWTAAHDYASGGTYNVTVALYYEDSSDVKATDTFQVTVEEPNGTLIVEKTVINDNGGTLEVSDFTLLVNEEPVVSGDENELAAGSYTVSESGPSGYTATFGGDCNANGDVEIVAGETKTCTIVNDDVAPTLTVRKQVSNNDGGTKTPSDFTLNVDGSNVSNPSFNGSAAGVTVTLDAGTFEVWETEDEDYAPSFTGACSGTIEPGENLTCTITNHDRAGAFDNEETGTLTVIKTVINDNGGTMEVADFTLFVNDEPVVSGEERVLAIGDHVVSESSTDGYTATYGGDCDTNGNVTLGLDENKTCTIVNDDASATLTVKKQVSNNDGGTKAPKNFTLNVDGTNVSDASFNGSAVGVTVTLDAGAFEVWETEDPGYAPSFLGSCSGTIGNGEHRTCTVVNHDKAGAANDTEDENEEEEEEEEETSNESGTATLTVFKQVSNNDGGIKEPGDFTLRVNGTNVTPSSFQGSAVGVTVTLDAGAFEVQEDDDPGYAASFIGDCEGTIEAGENLSCFVVNHDRVAGSARLTIQKIWETDLPEEDLPEIFISFEGGRVELDEETLSATFNRMAGQYALTEDPVSGFTTDIDCGETFYDAPSGLLTLEESTDVTCTITNTEETDGNTGGGGNDEDEENEEVNGSGNGGGGSSGGSSGGGGGGGGGLPSLNSVGGGPSGFLATPQVLGIQDTAEAILTCAEQYPTAAVITGDLDDLLAAYGFARDLPREEGLGQTILSKIIPAGVTLTQEQIIANFVVYGIQALFHLGEGERAGLVASFHRIYGAYPENECDWQNVIRIGEGVVPVVLVPEREATAEQAFEEIYDRAPNRTVGQDNVTVLIMAYGLRPDVRSMTAEIQANAIFRSIFGHFPGNTAEWDIMRGIAYGGITVPGFPPVTP